MHQQRLAFYNPFTLELKLNLKLALSFPYLHYSNFISIYKFAFLSLLCTFTVYILRLTYMNEHVCTNASYIHHNLGIMAGNKKLYCEGLGQRDFLCSSRANVEPRKSMTFTRFHAIKMNAFR